LSHNAVAFKEAIPNLHSMAHDFLVHIFSTAPRDDYM